MALIGLLSGGARADGGYTRGIGQYPGRLSQFTAPRMVKDTIYRNIALNRTVITSSCADFNLTGQLVTDGILTNTEPASLAVRTAEGIVGNRDKEKLIDGNIYTDMVLHGEHPFIEYHWKGMEVHISNIRLVGEIAYHAVKANRGYTVRILASHDGKQWEQIGKSESKELPGFASKQNMSSDPNKFRAAERLPLRLFKLNIPLRKTGGYAHLRFEFDMPGAARWRIFEIDHDETASASKPFTMDSLQWTVKNTSWLPSEHFCSVWESATIHTTSERQWLYVDLGTIATFNQINLYWVHKAQSGRIQVSDNAHTWTTVGTIVPGEQLTEKIPCKGHGRYVRLLLDKPDESGYYALSEMQVMGKGGLHSEPANTLSSPVAGRQMLNRWELCRVGSDNWIQATVPGTVLTSYMNIGAVPDNRYADNMRQISESFFNADFQYRTDFVFHKTSNRHQHTYLNFDGINWKADVWLNGRYLGRIEGAFKRGRFDITKWLIEGKNILEVRVIKNAHYGSVKQKTLNDTDKNGGVLGADNPTFHASIGWDWITSTPGREIGIWNDVYLSQDGGVGVFDPVVTTRLNQADTLATMTPAVLVRNSDNQVKHIKIKGKIGEIAFEQTVELHAQECREVCFSPNVYTQLRNRSMRLWWPNGYGEPYLYDASYQAVDSATGDVLSVVDYKVGVREMRYEHLDTQTTIYVNGKRLNPLGGNWGFSEINLNYRQREYDVAVRYHRDMNYNMIRNWVGQIGDEAFYAACDKYGILVWQDFWLANPVDGPNPYDEKMFLDNSADYISRIRNHACVGIYVGRNEGYPPETIDKALRRQIKAIHPQLGYISSSADGGVSGHGPYRMQSSTYYFRHQSQKLHSERGMPNVPNFESLQRMLPLEKLWPMSDAWGQHDYTLRGAQGGESFNAIMNKRFGTPKDARQFTKWAQWLNYDGYRAMYESAQQYRKGLLIWMSHACWPSMVWCTYDYYYEPTAAYFGVKKACEPLHIQFNSAKHCVEVVNSAGAGRSALEAKAEILDMWGKVLGSRQVIVSISEDETIQAMPIQQPDNEVYYLRLSLRDGNKILSENFYVLGRDEDNFQVLSTLPQSQLQTDTSTFAEVSDEMTGTVTVKNSGNVPALMIRLNLKGSDDEQILPVIYSDNYFSLMPGESKVVHVSYKKEDGRGLSPHIDVDCFNK